MLIHPLTDEILERLWSCREDGRVVTALKDLSLPDPEPELQAALDDLLRTYSVKVSDVIELSGPGEERARAITRRHRLAEILFTEVLDVEMKEAEASACEFEHMLSERVVDRVCTFLGHPPKCPHGKPIPQGSCCRMFERKVEPLITRLCDLPIGGIANIVFIAPKSAARLTRLAVLGIVPGTDIRLVQRKPSVVISCGQTSVAIEEDMAREIYVRTRAVA
jgi:DtxR family Mn-dependent transcriptional regulator